MIRLYWIILILGTSSFWISAPSWGGFLDDTDSELVYQEGYDDGYHEGRLTGHDDCRQDPASCHIALNTVLPTAQYGETEPNDQALSADALSFDVNFWGQSYSSEDQDWFYLVTQEPNINLMLNFSLPDATTPNLAGWTISIRNALGMVLAQFNTGFRSVDHASTGLSYRTTLGLAGIYYVVITPDSSTFNFEPYNVAVHLEASPLMDDNFAGGFYNVEIEPNNAPSQANWLTRGISVFGTINLMFDAAYCDETTCQYYQNEDDWYLYSSPGNEIIELSFCNRAGCEAGDWFVQIFDAATADAIQHHGLDPDQATPLMAFNTTITDTTTSALDAVNQYYDCLTLRNQAIQNYYSCIATHTEILTADATVTNYCIAPMYTDPQTCEFERQNTHAWSIGLRQMGVYFMRIGHQRTLNALCETWTTDLDSNGLGDGGAGACACPGGEAQCTIQIPNPREPIIATSQEVVWPACPDGTGGGVNGTACTANCLCSRLISIPDPNADPPEDPTRDTREVITICDGLYQSDINRDGVIDANAQACSCPGGQEIYYCEYSMPNPGTPNIVTIPDQTTYQPCPDGTGGGDDASCDIGCVCTAVNPEVLIPTSTSQTDPVTQETIPKVITVPYNFSWNSSLFAAP
jgi:hypothetical protein